MNSIRNKFENLRENIKRNVDALAAVATEIDAFFAISSMFPQRISKSL